MRLGHFVTSFLFKRKERKRRKEFKVERLIGGYVQKQVWKVEEGRSDTRLLSKQALDAIVPDAEFRIVIGYKDGRGRVTERIVHPKAVKPQNGKEILYGYCELRNRLRSFRLDRIEEMIDCDSGEVIEGDIGSWLHQRLEK